MSDMNELLEGKVMMTLAVTVGEALHMLRRRNGHTITDLSRLSGLPVPKITIIEKDRYKNFRLSDISKAFGVYGADIRIKMQEQE